MKKQFVVRSLSFGNGLCTSNKVEVEMEEIDGYSSVRLFLEMEEANVFTLNTTVSVEITT